MGSPLWADTTFIDERAERLLLGQVVTRPERAADMAAGLDHFNSSRRGVFRAVAACLRDGVLPDLVNVTHHGAPSLFVVAMMEEWVFDAPERLTELEATLDALLRRRRYAVLAARLRLAAYDPERSVRAVDETAQQVGRELMLLESAEATSAPPVRPDIDALVARALGVC